MFSGEYLLIEFTNNVRVEYILSMLLLCKIMIVLLHIQRSWSTANAKQREKLLELIRRLAEDDKDGVANMAKTSTRAFDPSSPEDRGEEL